MSRKTTGQRVNITKYDHLLRRLYIEEDLPIREIYKQLQERLDEDQWTTELAVRYRLQELGLKTPSGKFDGLELELLKTDPEDAGLSPIGERSPAPRT